MMKWKMIVVALVCASSMALAGCGGNSGSGGSGSGGGGGGGSAQSYDNFVQTSRGKLVNLLCSALYDCPQKQAPTIVVFGGRFDNKQDCLSHAADLFDISNANPQVEASLEAGRSTFDSAKAQSCLSSVQQLASSCPSFSKIARLVNQGACTEIVTPNQQEGDNCASDDECVSGNCDQSASMECYGTCGAAAQTAGEGEDCTGNCADGLVCADKADGSGSVCVQLASRQSGEPCDGSGLLCADGLVCGLDQTCGQPPAYKDNGATCNFTDSFCKPGLTCTNLTGTSASNISGTCGPLVAQGGACQQAFQCKAGLYCKTDGSQQSGTCAPLEDEGGACQSGDECRGNLSCDNSVCTAHQNDVCEVPSATASGGDAGPGTETDAGMSIDAG